MRAIVIVGVMLAAAGSGLGAQDSLSAAKDLYASAAYEDALSTLSRMDSISTAPDIARQVAEYRAFCLYALGRTREAESVAEVMIRKDPLARLAADASPRLEVMFADVRKRLLPSLIRERFRIARSALDQKSFGAAETPLTEARIMIGEAEKLGVKDDGLADLSILVDGFLQLIRSTADQRAAAQPAPPAGTVAAAAPPPVPRPAAASPVQTAASRPAAASPVQTAASRPAAASPALATASGPRVYSVDDDGVTPPVTIEQRMPAMTPEMQMITRALKTSGILDVIIDETGRVVDATIRQSLNNSFDTLIVRTSRNWKYRPAMKDGVAVRYLKTLVLMP
jgi:Gram-negative bacterial TonB protein C-terminal